MAKSGNIKRPTEEKALGRLKNWSPMPIDLEAIRLKNPRLADKIQKFMSEKHEAL